MTAIARQGRHMTAIARQRRLGWLLLLPLSLVSAAGFVVPLLWIARISLYQSQEGGVLLPGLTLDSYISFVTDDFYQAMVLRSVIGGLIITALVLLLTYPLALFLFRTRSKWRSLLVILTVSPLLVSAVVRTYGWMVILGDSGWLNAVLRAFDLPSVKLANNYTAVLIGLTQIMMPYMALALIAGFGRIDPTLEEAAATLGARPWRQFWRITFPLSLPGVGLGCLLTFVLSISAFVTPALLGGGRVFLIATEIYTQAIETLNWPLAAAISIILLVLFGAALGIYTRFAQRWAA
jgi:putative spermidine/putrescine transport system permease protein